MWNFTIALGPTFQSLFLLSLRQVLSTSRLSFRDGTRSFKGRTFLRFQWTAWNITQATTILLTSFCLFQTQPRRTSREDFCLYPNFNFYSKLVRILSLNILICSTKREGDNSASSRKSITPEDTDEAENGKIMDWEIAEHQLERSSLVLYSNVNFHIRRRWISVGWTGLLKNSARSTFCYWEQLKNVGTLCGGAWWRVSP